MKNILLLSFLLIGVILKGQDIQYSQFYANALYLNPAFAGANQNSRAIVHSRLQWPSIDATYLASTFSFDHYFPQYKSGVGLIINTDQIYGYKSSPTSKQQTFRNLDLGLQYAYQLELSDEWTFRPALQLSFGQRSFNSGKLQYVQQYTNKTGFDENLSSGENPGLEDIAPIYYPDASAGGLIYSSKFWVGIAANHLNRPSQSFLNNGADKLPIKTTLHTGMKFLIGKDKPRYGIDDSENEVSISPVLLYKMQGKNDQLDLGMYFRYDFLVLGTWYRGLPFKLYPSEQFNNDAIIAMAGGLFGPFNVGYSYDFTISKLAPALTGGSHELSVTYNFLVESYSKKKRPPSKNRKPVCPKF